MQQATPEARRCAAEKLALAAVHQVGLDRIAVVVAGQMEGAMGHEQVELQRQRYAQAPRLPHGRVGADDELSDERTVRYLEREREHVRTPGDSSVEAVQATDLGVIDHRHLDDPRRTAERGQRAVDGAHETRARNRDPPLPLVDDHGHQLDAARAPSSRSAPRASWAP
jgi:hypothetical protein